MPRMFVRVSLMATLLATAACTQEPAQVDLRGSSIFSRNGTTFNTLSPSYGKPAAQQPVHSSVPQTIAITSAGYSTTSSISAVSSSDLPPPPKAAAAKIEAKAEVAKPVELKHPPKPVAAKDGAVNPWTGKPRFTDSATVKEEESFNLQPKGKQQVTEQLVSDVRTPAPKQEKAIARLDRSEKAKTLAASGGFMWPVSNHKIISAFGPKGGGKANDGINIAAGEGEPVWAAADGEVVYVGNELQGYGNMVIIRHAGGKTTTYAHLNRYTADKYDRVKQGDIIGYVGSTGNVKTPQLHFAIRDGKDPVDPKKYLSRNVAGL